jgi:hypothetical protein
MFSVFVQKCSVTPKKGYLSCQPWADAPVYPTKQNIVPSAVLQSSRSFSDSRFGKNKSEERPWRRSVEMILDAASSGAETNVRLFLDPMSRQNSTDLQIPLRRCSAFAGYRFWCVKIGWVCRVNGQPDWAFLWKMGKRSAPWAYLRVLILVGDHEVIVAEGFRRRRVGARLKGANGQMWAGYITILRAIAIRLVD